MFSDSSSTSSGSEFNYARQYIPGEMEKPWAGEDQPEEAFTGQLKLSIYINCGLLTVHVVMGRCFQSQWKTSCDSYVKLCLIPDEGRRTKCKTEVAYDSNNPVFDEKFSFELLEEDIHKRLFLSVWHRDRFRNQCEFLGCMSFGMMHIQAQRINGWHQLLTGEVGRRKHRAIPERKTGLIDKGHTNKQPESDEFLMMDPHVFVIRRGGRSGFGFTIGSGCPVKVCRVDIGTAAESAGLQKSDCIIRIDGLNVSRSGAESVARIIRHAQKQIILEVQRPRRMESVKIESLEHSPRKPLHSSTPALTKLNNLNVSPWKPSLETLCERPASETQHYGWLDYHDDMRVDARLTSSGSSHSGPSYCSATLPRSFKQRQSPNWSKDYGWLDMKENISGGSQLSLGSLGSSGNRKRVTFQEFI